ncbi:MATE family efflux transporter [bacterium]|nr:MATE family efflux transporter [bacterium]
MCYLKKILKISLPNVIGLGSKFVCDLINIFWMAQVSTEAVAGVVTVTMITWMVIVFDDMFKAGAVSIVSRNYGAQKYSKVKSYIFHLLVWKTLFIVLFVGFVLILLGPILDLFVISDVKAAAYNYGLIRIATLPLQFLLFSTVSCLNCLGKGSLAMYPPLIANIINLLLDPIFIFKKSYGLNIGLGLNESGAALATAVSFLISSVIGWVILARHSRSIGAEDYDKSFSTQKMLNMLKIGYPVGIRNFIRHGTNLFLLKIVALYGTVHIAAYGTVGRMMGVYYVPILAFIMGGTALIGHEIGRKSQDGIQHISKTIFWCMCLIMGALLLFNIVYGIELIQFFSQSALGVESSYKLLVFGMLGFLFIALSAHKLAQIAASKNLNKLFHAVALSRLGVQVPLVIMFAFVLELPIGYIWLSFPIADFAEMGYLNFFK